MLKQGDTLPNLELHTKTGKSVESIFTDDYFAGKRVLLFAVPGAFTPTCSAKHLPGYVEHAAALRAKGIERIACLSVNDAFVLAAWGEKYEAAGAGIDLLADGSGRFTKAVGLELDLSDAGFGLRSQRYALLAEDKIVKGLWVEPQHSFGVSSAEEVLKQL